MPDRVTRFAGLVAGFAVLGTVCGLVWQWAWRPPPGVVYGDEWFLDPSGPDVGFAGTGLYVLIAAGAGLVAGLLVAWRLHGHEMVTLAGVLVGSTLAAWVMYAVGHALGPADPDLLAIGADDFSRLPAELDVGDESPFAPFGSAAAVAFPLGAVVGLAVLYLTWSPAGSRGGRHRSAPEDPAPR